MFSFGSQSSPFDEVVEKATAETLMEENWGLMMDINDKVSFEGQKGCKNVLLSIKKRLNNRDPHVVIYALSLLDCLWKNAGVEFRRCVSSKDFISELRDKAISSISAVANKACQIIKEWSENECTKDPSLALVSSLFKELKEQDLFLENTEPKKTKQVYSDDPNFANSAEEEAMLAKAIAESLNDVGVKKSQPSNQYPSLSSQPTPSNNAPQSYREVKALYEFEAAEDNELSLRAGDIVTVYDDSDPNWWKGQSHRGVGLFPSSFVSATEAENNVNYTNGNGSIDTPIEEPPVQIDEEALLKCIQLLEECDPTGETPDPPALAYFENMALQMAPLIDKKLANIDRQHNMLANVDIAMRDVLASYDQAVQQVPIPQMPQMYNGFSHQGYNMQNNGPQHQPGQFPMQNYGQFNPAFPSISQTNYPQQQGNFNHQQQAAQIPTQQAGQYPFQPQQQQQYQQFAQMGQAYPFPQQPGMPPTSSVNVSQGMSYPPQQQAHQPTPPPAAHLVHPQQQNQQQQQYQQFTQTGQAYPFSQQSTAVPPISNAAIVSQAQAPSNASPVPQQQAHQPTPPAAHLVHPQQQPQQIEPQQQIQKIEPSASNEQQSQYEQAPSSMPNNIETAQVAPLPQQQQHEPPQHQIQTSELETTQPQAIVEAILPQHEEQLINLDDTPTTPQSVASSQPLQQQPIVNPIPIVPQTNESQQFIAHIQAQGQQ